MRNQLHPYPSRSRTLAVSALAIAASAAIATSGLIGAAPASAAGGCTTTYYVSPSGSDAASGTTVSSAWKTIDKVNASTLTPGTCVYFAGGATFEGGIYLDSADAGSAAQHVVLGSYGTGKATIYSATNNGVFAYNTAGVTVQDLSIIGNGYDANGSTGIYFYNDLPEATQLSGITIQRVDVAWYGGSGIMLGAYPADGSKSGFTDILITASAAHDNADAGIQTYGVYSATAVGYAHHNVVIRDVQAFNNVGRIDKGNNSGNGIVLGDVDGALIEKSSAYNNGARNNWPGGGPVGIWAYDSNRVTIQYNESYENKSGTVDGGGFDLDGGVTNSVMQYNFSHDNEGAGYLVFQYVGARPLTDNVVRYNISRNDSRDGKYGAITVGSYGSPATNTRVYGNTIYMEPGSSANSSAAGIRVWENTVNAQFFNNSIHVTGGIPLVSVERDTTTTFRGNNYYSTGGSFLVLVGGSNFDDTAATHYASLPAWRNATGAERVNGTASGSTFEPKYAGDPATTAKDWVFALKPTSRLIGAGIDLGRLGISAGGRDYFGVPVPLLKKYSIGASQL